MKPGIYVHIPFCYSKCSYCSFYSSSCFSSSDVDDYFATLKKEIDYYSKKYSSRIFDTVYIGGGTPSSAGIDRLAELISVIKNSFQLCEKNEITVECNPSSVSVVDIEKLKNAGCGRISLGIQSFDASLLDVLGRKSCSVEKIRNILDSNMVDVSADLIAGIPGQTKESIINDINVLSAYNVKHISMYILSIEKDTPIAARITDDDIFQEMQINIFDKASEYLKSLSYEHYEISNYAMNGNYALHNMKYWTWSDYLGLGAASHSFMDGNRYANISDFKKYTADYLKYIENDSRSRDNAMAEYIMTSFRLSRGLSLQEMEKIFGSIPESFINKIEKSLSDGIIEKLSDGRISAFCDYFAINKTLYYLCEEFI